MYVPMMEEIGTTTASFMTLVVCQQMTNHFPPRFLVTRELRRNQFSQSSKLP